MEVGVFASIPWCWNTDDLGDVGFSPRKLVAALSALDFVGGNWGSFRFGGSQPFTALGLGSRWIPKLTSRGCVSFSLCTFNCLVCCIIGASFGEAELRLGFTSLVLVSRYSDLGFPNIQSVLQALLSLIAIVCLTEEIEKGGRFYPRS